MTNISSNQNTWICCKLCNLTICKSTHNKLIQVDKLSPTKKQVLLPTSYLYFVIFFPIKWVWTLSAIRYNKYNRTHIALKSWIRHLALISSQTRGGRSVLRFGFIKFRFGSSVFGFEKVCIKYRTKLVRFGSVFSTSVRFSSVFSNRFFGAK